MFKRIITFFVFFLLVWGNIIKTTWAADPAEITYKATIVKIAEQKDIQVEGNKQLYQKLEVRIDEGDKNGQSVIIENGNLPLANIVMYKVGDRVTVNIEKDLQGNDVYNINDFIRTDSLTLLAIIFILLILMVAKLRGLSAMMSMVITFLIIFYYILPQIIAGVNPIFVAIVGSMMIIPVTFYMSHGFNKKTTVAIVGTVIAMIITGILASVFIEIGKLTGLSSEEAGFLATIKQGQLNMKGVLLAGIVIGATGVLDDITVAQAATVAQLKQASEKMKVSQLYTAAMNVGQDHIASMINTLILVYAGAALPLMLIFVNNPHPFAEIVNYEFIAEEIIRTLVGSIGLVAAVPITTLIAAIVFGKKNNSVK